MFSNPVTFCFLELAFVFTTFIFKLFVLNVFLPPAFLYDCISYVYALFVFTFLSAYFVFDDLIVLSFLPFLYIMYPSASLFFFQLRTMPFLDDMPLKYDGTVNALLVVCSIKVVVTSSALTFSLTIPVHNNRTVIVTIAEHNPTLFFTLFNIVLSSYFLVFTSIFLTGE